MTCKDAINSDIKSDEEKQYLVSEVTRYNKIFEFEIQGSNNISDIQGNETKLTVITCGLCHEVGVKL